MLAGIAWSFTFLVLFRVSFGVPDERTLVTCVFYHAALCKQPSYMLFQTSDSDAHAIALSRIQCYTFVGAACTSATHSPQNSIVHPSNLMADLGQQVGLSRDSRPLERSSLAKWTSNAFAVESNTMTCWNHQFCIPGVMKAILGVSWKKNMHFRLAIIGICL